MRWLSLLAAAVPFAFGLIRLVQTGDDARYLFVASASLAGAAIVTWFASPLTRPKAFGVAAGVFVAATLFAVLGAMLLGTKLGPGILVVAAGFGGCFAAAAWLLIRSRT